MASDSKPCAVESVKYKGSLELQRGVTTSGLMWSAVTTLLISSLVAATATALLLLVLAASKYSCYTLTALRATPVMQLTQLQTKMMLLVHGCQLHTLPHLLPAQNPRCCGLQPAHTRQLPAPCRHAPQQGRQEHTAHTTDVVNNVLQCHT